MLLQEMTWPEISNLSRGRPRWCCAWPRTGRGEARQKSFDSLLSALYPGAGEAMRSP